MIAAGRVAEDAISKAVHQASEMRPHNRPITEKQRKAWEALAKALIQMRAEQAPPIAALIETPRGVLEAGTIASHSALCALGFGSEDYAGALGVPAEPAALTWPAQQVLTCAHAHGLQCWGLAASIAENAPLTQHAAKRSMDALLFARGVPAGPEALDQRFQAAREAVAACGQSNDYREVARAFMEKRPPRFEGN
jgi:hypothetical protein